MLNTRSCLSAALAAMVLVSLQGCQHTSEPPPPAAAPPVAQNQFVDVSDKVGIHFKHENGAFGKKWLPETMGSGVAFLDYDEDGFPDIFVVNSRGWTPEELRQGHAAGLSSRPTTTTCHLYHNNENETFTDVTKGSGLDIPMYGMGACAADYDNDGHIDLYVTALGRNYLFHNDGHGKFTDVTEKAGVKSYGWSTSAAWVDYDRDGKLDLFVCHYVNWTPATDIPHSLDGIHKSYARPDVYTGEKDQLFHNNGNGTFTDVSSKAGITQTKDGHTLQSKSLGVAICDFDNDGWPDIAVTNDTQPNYLFRNNHNGTFTEMATSAGIAFSESGQAKGAMGIDAADYNHSGRDSFLIGNFSNEMLSLYENQGSGLFIDAAPTAGVGPPTLLSLSFGVSFLDYDDDGWPDILIANGHVDDDIQTVQKQVSYAEKPLLFRNMGNGKFQNVSASAGAVFQTPMVARGLACGDFDLDGYPDVAITTSGGALKLLHNTGGTSRRIRLELVGIKSNRSAIGAKVRVVPNTAGAAGGAGKGYELMVRSGSSYLSQSELPLTCGLGQADSATVTVTWPSGMVSVLKNLAPNKIYHVQEGRGVVFASLINTTSKIPRVVRSPA